MTDWIDGQGRQIDYLRLSVTDRCDFRCVYCMAEDMRFLPRQQVLTLEEIERVARLFVAGGVRKLRLTGGEPLVRPGIVGLCERLAALPGLRELCMTSNGSQLVRYARPLYDAGLSRLNISLDTLDPLRFRAITRNGELDKVLAGIDAAQAAGFRRIKLNAVVMKGRNADEVPALVDFAIARGLDISFIEEMPLGQVGRERGESFCSSDEVRALIAQRHALLDSAEQSGGPARYVRLVEHPQTRIGFISPHSHNFCVQRAFASGQGEAALLVGQQGLVAGLAAVQLAPGKHHGITVAGTACDHLAAPRVRVAGHVQPDRVPYVAQAPFGTRARRRPGRASWRSAACDG